MTPTRRRVTLRLALWRPSEHFGGHGRDGFQVSGDGAQLQPQHDQPHDHRPGHDNEQLALQTDEAGHFQQNLIVHACTPSETLASAPVVSAQDVLDHLEGQLGPLQRQALLVRSCFSLMMS